MDHILSIVLFWPLAALLVLVFIPSTNARAVKLWANVASFFGFLVSLPLVFNFDPPGISSSWRRRVGFLRSAPAITSASTASACCW